ncbi:hypothetical protein BESB_033640 [Besnoitia besnoiti]|uniref:PHD-type domain-containing protein n=1 Tax=Besnoitia besnoiti TaxID=94643 RepID=A0A2A9MLJ5_BESBE|nr:hypothetical protein BESB_033640 [Besnoitia besnoiti]PFH36906.1 hypothetical protein BESB_033640 [Besnoitia besnoiti]
MAPAYRPPTQSPYTPVYASPFLPAPAPALPPGARPLPNFATTFPLPFAPPPAAFYFVQDARGAVGFGGPGAPSPAPPFAPPTPSHVCAAPGFAPAAAASPAQPRPAGGDAERRAERPPTPRASQVLGARARVRVRAREEDRRRDAARGGCGGRRSRHAPPRSPPRFAPSRHGGEAPCGGGLLPLRGPPARSEGRRESDERRGAREEAVGRGERGAGRWSPKRTARGPGGADRLHALRSFSAASLRRSPARRCRQRASPHPRDVSTGVWRGRERQPSVSAHPEGSLQASFSCCLLQPRPESLASSGEWVGAPRPPFPGEHPAVPRERFEVAPGLSASSTRLASPLAAAPSCPWSDRSPGAESLAQALSPTVAARDGAGGLGRTCAASLRSLSSLSSSVISEDAAAADGGEAPDEIGLRLLGASPLRSPVTSSASSRASSPRSSPSASVAEAPAYAFSTLAFSAPCLESSPSPEGPSAASSLVPPAEVIVLSDGEEGPAAAAEKDAPAPPSSQGGEADDKASPAEPRGGPAPRAAASLERRTRARDDDAGAHSSAERRISRRGGGRGCERESATSLSSLSPSVETDSRPPRRSLRALRSSSFSSRKAREDAVALPTAPAPSPSSPSPPLPRFPAAFLARALPAVSPLAEASPPPRVGSFGAPSLPRLESWQTFRALHVSRPVEAKRRQTFFRGRRPRDLKVAILGAGMSGISAARELRDAGVKSVVVYEARSRVGGRCCSASVAAEAPAQGPPAETRVEPGGWGGGGGGGDRPEAGLAVQAPPARPQTAGALKGELTVESEELDADNASGAGAAAAAAASAASAPARASWSPAGAAAASSAGAPAAAPVAAESVIPGIDLGASWIHGIDGNPVYAICLSHGLHPFGAARGGGLEELPPPRAAGTEAEAASLAPAGAEARADEEEEAEEVLFDEATGERVDVCVDAWAYATHQRHQKEADLSMRREEEPRGGRVLRGGAPDASHAEQRRLLRLSLGEVLNAKMRQAVRERRAAQTARQKRDDCAVEAGAPNKEERALQKEDESATQNEEEGVAQEGDSVESRLLLWHLNNLEYSAGADVEDLSMVCWDQDDLTAFQGHHVLIWEGYKAAVEVLTRDLDIRFRHVISKISYDDTGVVLAFENGDVSPRFDFCIITLPLGVLKASVRAYEESLEAQPSAGAEAQAGAGTGAAEEGHSTEAETDEYSRGAVERGRDGAMAAESAEATTADSRRGNTQAAPVASADPAPNSSARPESLSPSVASPTDSAERQFSDDPDEGLSSPPSAAISTAASPAAASPDAASRDAASASSAASPSSIRSEAGAGCEQEVEDGEALEGSRETVGKQNVGSWRPQCPEGSPPDSASSVSTSGSPPAASLSPPYAHSSVGSLSPLAAHPTAEAAPSGLPLGAETTGAEARGAAEPRKAAGDEGLYDALHDVPVNFKLPADILPFLLPAGARRKKRKNASCEEGRVGLMPERGSDGGEEGSRAISAADQTLMCDGKSLGKELKAEAIETRKSGAHGNALPGQSDGDAHECERVTCRGIKTEDAAESAEPRSVASASSSAASRRGSSSPSPCVPPRATSSRSVCGPNSPDSPAAPPCTAPSPSSFSPSSSPCSRASSASGCSSAVSYSTSAVAALSGAARWRCLSEARCASSRGLVAFEPPLPEWKREAVKLVGMGNMNKIALVFRTPFWIYEDEEDSESDAATPEGPPADAGGDAQAASLPQRACVEPAVEPAASVGGNRETATARADAGGEREGREAAEDEAGGAAEVDARPCAGRDSPEASQQTPIPSAPAAGARSNGIEKCEEEDDKKSLDDPTEACTLLLNAKEDRGEGSRAENQTQSNGEPEGVDHARGDSGGGPDSTASSLHAPLPAASTGVCPALTSASPPSPCHASSPSLFSIYSQSGSDASGVPPPLSPHSPTASPPQAETSTLFFSASSSALQAPACPALAADPPPALPVPSSSLAAEAAPRAAAAASAADCGASSAGAFSPTFSVSSSCLRPQTRLALRRSEHLKSGIGGGGRGAERGGGRSGRGRREERAESAREKSGKVEKNAQTLADGGGDRGSSAAKEKGRKMRGRGTAAGAAATFREGSCLDASRDGNVESGKKKRRAPIPRQRGWASKEKGRYAQLVYLHPKPIILVLVPGAFSFLSEKQPKEALVAEALRVLIKIHRGRIEAPVKAFVSRWGSDPFARGSYSYLPPGTTGRDFDLLSYPVHHRLLFAGEHTIRPYPSTVHGACLSGRREATRILDWVTGLAEKHALLKWFQNVEEGLWFSVDLNEMDAAAGYFEDCLEGPTAGERDQWFAAGVRCAFCGEPQTFQRPFIGCVSLPVPRGAPASGEGRTGGAELALRFAAHEDCCYHTPGVVSDNEGSRWFNVGRALLVAGARLCACCRQPGANIPCAAHDCDRAVHLPCAQRCLNWPRYSQVEPVYPLFCPAHQHLLPRRRAAKQRRVLPSCAGAAAALAATACDGEAEERPRQSVTAAGARASTPLAAAAAVVSPRGDPARKKEDRRAAEARRSEDERRQAEARRTRERVEIATSSSVSLAASLSLASGLRSLWTLPPRASQERGRKAQPPVPRETPPAGAQDDVLIIISDDDDDTSENVKWLMRAPHRKESSDRSLGFREFDCAAALSSSSLSSASLLSSLSASLASFASSRKRVRSLSPPVGAFGTKGATLPAASPPAARSAPARPFPLMPLEGRDPRSLSVLEARKNFTFELHRLFGRLQRAAGALREPSGVARKRPRSGCEETNDKEKTATGH